MSNIIRFVNKGLRITLLILDNGSVCQLRKGDETFRHTPPAWDSLSEWADGDLATLKSVYSQILSVSDDEILNLIALLKKHKLDLNLYGNNTKAKIDYLYVKTTDGELVPLYVSYKGLVSYKGTVGASFKSVGLTNPDFWINDISGTLINISQNSAVNLNTVIEEEPLVWEQDSQGLMRWCHPIFRWFTENDGDVLPDWLKRLVEAHPKFRGWATVPPTTASPYVEPTTVVVDSQNNDQCVSVEPVEGSIVSTYSVSKDVSSNDVVVCKDISSNDVSVCKDVSSNDVVVCKDVSSNDVVVCKDVSSNVVVVFKDCSSNVVSVFKDCSSNVVSVSKDIIQIPVFKDINAVPLFEDCSSNVVSVSKESQVPVCRIPENVSSNVVSTNCMSVSEDNKALVTRLEKLEKQIAQQNAVLKGLTAPSACCIIS